MMDKHLERALIETYFAISEFALQKSSPDWPGNLEETEALASALHSARTALEASVRRARDIVASGSSKSLA
jgi:hypothetical protein